MSNPKYIPGDLVMTNEIPLFPLTVAKGVVYRVTGTNPNKTLKCDGGAILKGAVCLETDEGDEFGAWVKDIIPIPLTSEILEKNGWKKENVGYSTKNQDPIFLYKDNGGGWAVEIGDEFISVISFVHQLQHLLFGLGLDSNMIV